jgi:hypothetical protein
MDTSFAHATSKGVPGYPKRSVSSKSLPSSASLGFHRSVAEAAPYASDAHEFFIGVFEVFTRWASEVTEEPNQDDEGNGHAQQQKQDGTHRSISLYLNI